MLVCGDCGCPDIKVTEAEETTDASGSVVAFEEDYECPRCYGQGTYSVAEDNTDTLTGCLGRSTGGVC